MNLANLNALTLELQTERRDLEKNIQDRVAKLRAATPPCSDVRLLAGQLFTCIERSPYHEANIEERCVPCRAHACLDRFILALGSLDGWENWMR